MSNPDSLYFPLDFLASIYESKTNMADEIINYCIARRLSAIPQDELSARPEYYISKFKSKFNIDPDTGVTDIGTFYHYLNDNPHLPFTKLSCNAFWRFNKSSLSDEEKNVLVLYCVLNSLIGKKKYCQTNWATIEERILKIHYYFKGSNYINVSMFSKTFKNIHKPNKRRVRNHLMEKVMQTFKLSYYSGKGVRGFYISTQLSNKKLEEAVKTPQKKTYICDKYEQ